MSIQQARSKCKDIGVRLENAGDTTEQLNRSNREVGVEEQAESEVDFQIHRVVPEERQTSTAKVCCEMCGNQFNSQWQLMEHLQRSTRCLEYDAECPGCGKYYKGEKGLSSHISRGGCSQSRVKELIQDSSHCLPQGYKSGSLTNQESPQCWFTPR